MSGGARFPEEMPTPCCYKFVCSARGVGAVLPRRAFGTSGQTQVWNEKRVVGYSCKQLFTVVSEVEKYCEFIPYCKKSVVTLRKGSSLSANLLVGFQPFLNISYTSHVTLIEPYLVTAVCKDMKLFEHLRTVWKFSPLESTTSPCCEVDFAVSFKFLHDHHSTIARLVLDEMVKKNMQAFLTRTTKVYGPEGPVPSHTMKSVSSVQL